MKNWALLIGGLALLGVVLLVLIGGNGGESQNQNRDSQPITKQAGPQAASQDQGIAAEASMDRRDAEPTEAGLTPNEEEAADGFVTALPFTGPAADISLRLLDGQGRPAAGAHLRVDIGWGVKNQDLKDQGVIDDEAWQKGNKIAADDQGRILIQLPAIATMSLYVGGPTWRMQNRQLQPLAAGDSVDLGDIHLSPANFLQGEITNELGEGLAEATVQVSPAGANYWGGGFSTAVQSDDDGHYELPSVPAGSYQVTVVAKGYIEHKVERLELGLQQSLEEDFILSTGDRVRGQVLAADGTPLAGAQVYLVPLPEEVGYWGNWRPSLPEGDGQTQSDDQGMFSVHGIEAGRSYVIGARAEGHAEKQMDYEGKNEDLTLRLDPAFAVSGKLSSHDGTALPGLAVVLIRVDGSDEEEQVAYAETEESGLFDLRHHGAGSYRVEVNDAPIEVTPITLQLQEDRTDLQIKLPKAPSLRIHVLNKDGLGIPFATVSLAPPGSEEQAMDFEVMELGYASLGSVSFGNSNHFGHGAAMVTSKTDESGWAAFPAIEGGDYELFAHALGYAQLTEPLSLGLESKEAEITLTSGANLQLFLTDDSGGPVANLPVTLKNAATGVELESVNTDALGRAVWQDLEAGLYQIAYRANDADGWWWGNEGNDEAAHDQPVVEIKAGEDKEQTLIIHDLALLTVVVQRGGLPAAGIGVRIQEVQDENHGWYYGGNETGKPTDGRGHITLSPVKAGTYEVIVKSSLDTPELRERIELHGGQQTVEISLVGARIEGSLLDKNSGPLAGAKVALIPYEEEVGEDGQAKRKKPRMVTNWGPNGVEFTDIAEMSTMTRSDEFGNYAFRDVPAGRWMVVARAEGHSPWTSQPKQVQSGNKVDFGTNRLSAMATIEGRDHNWQPNQDKGNNNYFNWGNSVRLELAEGGQNVAMAQIDENGKFRLTEIGAGTYRLRKGKYRSEPFELREGEMIRMDIPIEEPEKE